MVSTKKARKIDQLQIFFANPHQQTENEIDDEGARALSDALETNTTLQSLDLAGEQEESDEDR